MIGTSSTLLSETSRKIDVYVDSGATDHMIKINDQFSSFREPNNEIRISSAKKGEDLKATQMNERFNENNLKILSEMPIFCHENC